MNKNNIVRYEQSIKKQILILLSRIIIGSWEIIEITPEIVDI